MTNRMTDKKLIACARKNASYIAITFGAVFRVPAPGKPVDMAHGPWVAYYSMYDGWRITRPSEIPERDLRASPRLCARTKAYRSSNV